MSSGFFPGMGAFPGLGGHSSHTGPVHELTIWPQPLCPSDHLLPEGGEHSVPSCTGPGPGRNSAQQAALLITTTHLEWESRDSSFRLWAELKPRDPKATQGHTAAGG